MFTRYTIQFKIKSYSVYFFLAFVISGIFLLFSFQSLKIRRFVHVQEEYTDILSLRYSFTKRRNLNIYETTDKFNELKRRFQSKSLKDAVPARDDSCVNCSKNDFKIILSQEKMCKTPPKIDILILISSAPSEYVQRRAIRQTWGSRCNHIDSRIKCVFVIGNFRSDSANIDKIRTFPSKVVDDSYNSQLRKESEDFKDIVQFDFIDSYGNLTYKTLSGLKWAVNVCASAEYVMKTDTDMFVNTELLPLLVQAAPRTLFMGGFCWGPSFPHRDISSKWFVSYKSYRHHQFPPMCSGTGYIMSRDVVQLILRNSQNVPFFHLEDVYISLCIQKTDVTSVKLAGFSNLRTQFEDCDLYKNNVITSHYMNPEVLYDYWEKLKSCNISISPEEVYRELEFTPLL